MPTVIVKGVEYEMVRKGALAEAEARLAACHSECMTSECPEVKRLEARLAAETERAQLNGKAFLAAKDRIAALEAENRELRLKLNAPSALRIAARTRGGKTR